MNNKKQEIKTINIQLFALVVSLFSAIISIIITYNQKLELEDKDPIYSASEIFKITLFNRILILVLSFVFLYVNFELFNISKEEGEDLKSYKLQIAASILVVISGLIALYVVSLSTTENIVDVENPVI